MAVEQKGYVRSAGKKGRGVFARKKLNSGTIIEVSPYIEIPPKDDPLINDSVLGSYWFEVKGKRSAIGLGHTSLYNHSEAPNASFSLNARRRRITIKALKAIRQDEEITIDYGYKLDL